MWSELLVEEQPCEFIGSKHQTENILESNKGQSNLGIIEGLDHPQNYEHWKWIKHIGVHGCYEVFLSLCYVGKELSMK